jgi:putative drug exporter of the RND superfamily
MDRAHV